MVKTRKESNCPLRVPKHIPLSFARPSLARAGEQGRWRLEFFLAESIPEGERLGVQFHGGRYNKVGWQHLQAQDPAASGFVSIRWGDETLPLDSATDDPGSLYFRVPAGGLRKGERLEVLLGGPVGATAPPYALDNKFFLLFLPQPRTTPMVPGTNPDPGRKVVAACLIHVTGNALSRLRAFAAPSHVRPGEAVRLLVRPEDSLGNVACQAPDRLIVRLQGRELTTRRVGMPDSTCCVLEGIVLPGPGVYRLEVEDVTHGLRTTANPIECFPGEESARVLWGMIHGHTEISDGVGTLDHYFRYMRDECALDFGAPGDHDNLFETSDAMWQMTQEAVARYHEADRFVTFLGYEWAKWRRNGDGDRNVYYLHDGRPMFRSDEGHFPTPPDLFRALKGETAIVIPHHTAVIGNPCDWKDHDPEKERLVEIYSCWGSSERSVHDGDPFPVRPAKRQEGQALDAGEVPAGFVQRALELGWRVGFVGGGDDHHGHPGDDTLSGWGPWRYKAGLMAVWATGRTRQAIWEAMWKRRCYASTGARMIVHFVVNGHPMGSQLSLTRHPGLALVRQIEVRVHGTAAIARVEIVRNNQDVYVYRGEGPDVLFTWQDRTPLAAINLPPARWSATPFTFYYLRVTQADGEMAWASPVWIES